MSEGFVYVLTNQAMPGYVKIGLTRGNDVASRMKQLDTTAVPLSFECHFAARVPDCAKLERTLHFVFGEKRARQSREFFKIEPDLAKAIIELVALEDVALTDQEQAIDPDQRREIEAAKARREVRTFTSLGIPVGSELKFLKDPDVTCTVIGPRRVRYDGIELSPSRAALNAVHAMGYNWRAVSGMDYWTYDGIRLCELPDIGSVDDSLPSEVT